MCIWEYYCYKFQPGCRYLKYNLIWFDLIWYYWQINITYRQILHTLVKKIFVQFNNLLQFLYLMRTWNNNPIIASNGGGDFYRTLWWIFRINDYEHPDIHVWANWSQCMLVCTYMCVCRRVYAGTMCKVCTWSYMYTSFCMWCIGACNHVYMKSNAI